MPGIHEGLIKTIIFSGANPANNDTLAVVFSTGLNNYYPHAVTLTATASGDTLATFIAKMVSMINSNTVLSGHGVSATSSGGQLNIVRSQPYGNYVSVTTNFATGTNVNHIS